MTHEKLQVPPPFEETQCSGVRRTQVMKVELQGEAGIDVQVYLAGTLSEWIDTLNTEHPSTRSNPYSCLNNTETGRDPESSFSCFSQAREKNSQWHRYATEGCGHCQVISGGGIQVMLAGRCWSLLC